MVLPQSDTNNTSLLDGILSTDGSNFINNWYFQCVDQYLLKQASCYGVTTLND